MKAILRQHKILFRRDNFWKANLVITKCCEQTRFTHWHCHLSRPVAAIKIHTDYVGAADYAGTAVYAEINEQLDLRSIQHRDYFGHLSILESTYSLYCLKKTYSNLEVFTHLIILIFLVEIQEWHKLLENETVYWHQIRCNRLQIPTKPWQSILPWCTRAQRRLFTKKD